MVMIMQDQAAGRSRLPGDLMQGAAATEPLLPGTVRRYAGRSSVAVMVALIYNTVFGQRRASFSIDTYLTILLQVLLYTYCYQTLA